MKPKIPWSKPPSLLTNSVLGWALAGDTGGWTFYTTRRHRIVMFPHSPPLVPPYPDQAYFRQRWLNAAVAWRAIGKPAQARWTAAAARAHLTITGYNLWTYWAMTSDTPAIRTIERQTRLTLLSANGQPAQ